MVPAACSAPQVWHLRSHGMGVGLGEPCMDGRCSAAWRWTSGDTLLCLQAWTVFQSIQAVMMSTHGSAEQLTLLRSPIRTLYYFSCSVTSGLASAAHFVATHPFTLFLALPTLLSYLVCVVTGSATEYTAAAEVCSLDTCTDFMLFRS